MVVNLSSYTLSATEQSILSKGLSFIPQPRSMDKTDISIGLNRFHTQMCMQYEQATCRLCTQTYSTLTALDTETMYM